MSDQNLPDREREQILEEQRDEMVRVQAKAIEIAWWRFRANFAAVAGFVDVAGDRKSKGALAAAEAALGDLEAFGCFR